MRNYSILYSGCAKLDEETRELKLVKFQLSNEHGIKSANPSGVSNMKGIFLISRKFDGVA